MSDIEVIHEHADGYTETGHTVSYTDGYIKFRKTFRYKALRLLKGAPLPVFLDVALADEPPDVQTICANTGYGAHSVCAALEFLVSHNFLEELGREGRNGVKRYRACSFTWSGSDRNAPPDVDTSNSTASGHRIAKNAIRQARIAIRPVVDVGIPNSIENKESANRRNNKQQYGESRRILREAGIIFQNVLEKLAWSVRPDNATLWVLWMKCVDPKPRSVQAVCVAALQQDPDAPPPVTEEVLDEWREATDPEFAEMRQSERARQANERMREQEETCGTLAHKYWAPHHGGCARCGIPAKE